MSGSSSSAERFANTVAKVSQTFFMDGSFSLESDPSPNIEKVVHSHKVCNILICNNQLRMIFKIHYNYLESATILGYNDKIDKFERVDDFYLEVCNLVAGRLKLIFQESGYSLGISIPIKSDGFDELYFPMRFNDLVGEFCWDLKKNEQSISMSVFVEVVEPKDFENFDQDTLDINSGEQDDIEFL